MKFKPQKNTCSTTGTSAVSHIHLELEKNPLMSNRFPLNSTISVTLKLSEVDFFLNYQIKPTSISCWKSYIESLCYWLYLDKAKKHGEKMKLWSLTWYISTQLKLGTPEYSAGKGENLSNKPPTTVKDKSCRRGMLCRGQFPL